MGRILFLGLFLPLLRERKERRGETAGKGPPFLIRRSTVSQIFYKNSPYIRNFGIFSIGESPWAVNDELHP